MRPNYKLAAALFTMALIGGNLAACAQTPGPVVEKPVIVEKPVPVACVDKAKVPAEPAKVAGDLNGQARHDLDLVAASAMELRVWGKMLVALVQPCTKP